ncbi:hypothetical protein AB1N83_012510 [Pleurotus pulmonarius]|nr:hypothetical protein EYR36_006652 [Pleurotus pulmonarius]KAF4601348.1 hypothetical protein EYR38_006000 [Pleurotus pulmonarius]
MPTEPGSSGQAGSSKRRREASPPPAAASSAQPGAPPKKRRRPGPKVPEAKKGRKKAHTYHMTTEQVPEGAKGLKRAVEVHARILGLALTNTSIPTAPSHHQVEQFEQRFTHSSNLDALLKGVSNLGNSRAAADALAKLRRDTLKSTSITARDIKSVPDSAIRMMFGALHCFGLSVWSPDFTSTPTSLYNSALESIFMSTFEQAAISYAYRNFEFDMALIKDTRLLCNLFRNFVWSYWLKLSEKEARRPGSIVKQVIAGSAYRRRSLLTAKRASYLHEHRYSSRIQQLVCAPECTSDDERDPDLTNNGFRVFPKPARSSLVTEFFRAIDKARMSEDVVVLQRRQTYRRPEPRTEYPPTTAPSDLSLRVPENCPLDWFDPTFFNKLPIRFRGKYRKSTIALPLKDDYDGMKDWERMPDDVFMKTYGDKVRAQYNLPTDEELDELDDLDSEEDSDSTEVPPNARAGPSAQEGHSEQDEEDIQADLADDI